jgi:hypothetical protein
MPVEAGSRGTKNLTRPMPKEVAKYSGLDELARFQTKVERQGKRHRRSIGITSGPDFPLPITPEVPSPSPQAVRINRPIRRRRRGFQSTFLTRGGLASANVRKTRTLGA